MSVALLVITDGRDGYLAQAVASAEAALIGDITERWMYDDTGDEPYRAMLRARYPDFEHINAGPRQGFGGAIRYAWNHLLGASDADHIFHLEQDFTFNVPIRLDEMIAVLDYREPLVQVALKRQPWNEQEKAAGGICQMQPDAWTSYAHSFDHLGVLRWCEQTMFFTTNPCLYERDLMTHGWPEVAQSEGHFSIMLRNLGYRFGFLGDVFEEPKVHHIGLERSGTGY